MSFRGPDKSGQKKGVSMSGSFIRAAAEEERPLFDVYAFATPNSVKVPIALEELGLSYTLHGVNVRKGEQKTPEFLAFNPNGKVPILLDRTVENGPFVLTESAAIFVYLDVWSRDLVVRIMYEP
ncbi:putative glutathione S-transferase [Gluconacetobacter diazotrophicus PA1 5]|uniref:Putative glutathione S-transferase n=2 Tax=Gluconacetobacter diazotrophicus TaxID=33996 RepID=A9HA57_GLUDA|nr:glutathione S-transferase N-terminal domain-containing protein [Gluconacetobacter diazotrophicus]CAP57796.1 putative glutathione S-transferase [Gluconacetobacter diazotrophicus PA1 5]